MGITYQEEKFENLIPELVPLFKIHWEELAINKDIRPLDVDYVGYCNFNRMGVIKVHTVRKDGELIGYSFWFINNNLHYKSWVMAKNDVYWLHPDHRKSGIGTEMFTKIKDWLKDMGVMNIVIQTKTDHPHEDFFQRLGFTKTESNYEMVI